MRIDRLKWVGACCQHGAVHLTHPHLGRRVLVAEAPGGDAQGDARLGLRDRELAVGERDAAVHPGVGLVCLKNRKRVGGGKKAWIDP